MLAEHPVGLALGAGGDVVVAAHFLAVPPARLDALRTRGKLELALDVRLAVARDEALRALQEPGGADWAPILCLPGIRFLCLPGVGRRPIPLRTMIVRQ